MEYIEPASESVRKCVADVFENLSYEQRGNNSSTDGFHPIDINVLKSKNTCPSKSE